MNYIRLIARRGALLFLMIFSISASNPTDANAPKPEVEKQRFVILYSPGPKWIKDKFIWDQPLQEHGKYMHTLFSKKTLVMGGPFSDSSGGMAIIDAESDDQARKIVQDDPAVKSQIFSAAIHAWLPIDWQKYGQ